MTSWLVSVLSINIRRLLANEPTSDKYAAELGYFSGLTGALLKRQSAEGHGDIDVVFSMYYNPAPAMSERLAALDKWRRETVTEEGDLISLDEEEKK